MKMVDADDMLRRVCKDESTESALALQRLLDGAEPQDLDAAAIRPIAFYMGAMLSGADDPEFGLSGDILLMRVTDINIINQTGNLARGLSLWDLRLAVAALNSDELHWWNLLQSAEQMKIGLRACHR